MRKRSLIYLLVGVCFGIVDWYFLKLFNAAYIKMVLSHPLFDEVAIRRVVVIVFESLNWATWLIPVVPTAVYEMRRSASNRQTILAVITVWSAAIFSYYAYYTFLLMFVGLPHLEFMLLAQHQSPTYWANWWPPFRQLILSQFAEWIGVALLRGALIGALSAYLFTSLSKKRLQIN